MHCTIFPLTLIFSIGFFLVRFLTRQHLTRIMDIKGKCYEYRSDAIMASIKYIVPQTLLILQVDFVFKLL